LIELETSVVSAEHYNLKTQYPKWNSVQMIKASTISDLETSKVICKHLALRTLIPNTLNP